MAPYQAFAIGGTGSVRGYGEGAVGSGRLCLVANCEYTIPLVCENDRIFLQRDYAVLLKLINPGSELWNYYRFHLITKCDKIPCFVWIVRPAP